MNVVLSYIVLAAWIIAGLGFLFIAIKLWKTALGYRKNNVVKTKAYLSKTDYQRNVLVARKLNPHYTNTMYTYVVDGKEYYFEFGMNEKPNKIGSMIELIYQKSNPSEARPHGVVIRICF